MNGQKPFQSDAVLQELVVHASREPLPFQGAVPVVLDRIVGAARQKLGNRSPLITMNLKPAMLVLELIRGLKSASAASRKGHYLMRLDNDSIFPLPKWVLLDNRVKLVAPAEPATFATAPLDSHCNH